MEKTSVQRRGQQDAAYKKWVHIWSTVQNQVTNLPKWAQDTLFDDINTSVQNRIVVMQKAQ